MAKASAPSVVIINRNYPPRAGVTGESACTLASHLEQQEIDVSIVTVKSEYAGGGSKMDPVGTIHEIASWYDGKNKILRLLFSFMESFWLVRKAKKLDFDQTIVMTDPPFLSFWASHLLGGNRNWVLWAMDLFPEAFVAGNLSSDHGWLYRFLKRTVYRNTPNSLIALGPLQAGYLKSQYGQQIDTSIVPCGVFKGALSTDSPNWKLANAEKIILGYCGNLGEAHSPEFLINVIDYFDKEKMHLVLSLYGAKAKIILDYVKDKMDGISLVDSVSRPQLGSIDVHLVSLLGRWANICVPSKAVSAVCSESSFLFYGTANCDNWHLLGEGGWLIEDTDNAADQARLVSDALQQINQTSLLNKKTSSRKIATKLQAMIDQGFAEIGNRISDSAENR